MQTPFGQSALVTHSGVGEQNTPLVLTQALTPSVVGKQKQFGSVPQFTIDTQLSLPAGHWPGQVPQSCGQLLQSSPSAGSQTPSPQNPHGPQSSGQLKQSSPAAGSQFPSPQTPGHGPQSSGQVLQSSPAAGSQFPSPQTPGHGPQS